MGGGISKSDLEIISGQRNDLQNDLDKMRDRIASLSSKLELEMTHVENFKKEIAGKEEIIQETQNASQKLKLELRQKDNEIEELNLKVAHYRSKLDEANFRALKGALKVAGSVIKPENEAAGEDEGSLGDSIVNETKEAVHEMLSTCASQDPTYTNLLAQIESLENTIEVERSNTELLGNQLLLRASTHVIENNGQGGRNLLDQSSYSLPDLEGTMSEVATQMFEKDDSNSVNTSGRENLLSEYPRKQKASYGTLEDINGQTLRNRDYSVLVDSSSSMRLTEREFYNRSRWNLAQETLELLVPKVVSRDDDGITLYFFSTKFQKFSHVSDEKMVSYYFSQVNQPKGSSDLSNVLQDALLPDNIGKPKTIMVISDGVPDNRQEIEAIVLEAAETLVKEDDLRIVFIHVGTDYRGMKWLKSLKSKSSRAKVDIVEIISTKKLLKTGIPFAQWVSRSVMPELLTRVQPNSTPI